MHLPVSNFPLSDCRAFDAHGYAEEAKQFLRRQTRGTCCETVVDAKLRLKGIRGLTICNALLQTLTTVPVIPVIIWPNQLQDQQVKAYIVARSGYHIV